MVVVVPGLRTVVALRAACHGPSDTTALGVSQRRLDIRFGPSLPGEASVVPRESDARVMRRRTSRKELPTIYRGGRTSYRFPQSLPT